MSMFPEGFVPEQTKTTLRIALRRTPPSGAKRTPTLSGYVIMRVEQARTILELCESQPDKVAFLNVALWDNSTDPKYPLTGNISTRMHTPAQEEGEKLERKDLPPSLWY